MNSTRCCLEEVGFRTLGSYSLPSSLALAAVKAGVKDFVLYSFKGFDPEKMVAATVLYEGSRRQVTFQQQRVSKLASSFGGLSGGSENGRRGYFLT